MVIWKGAALRRIDISLLETGRHPKTASTTSLCTKKSNPILMSVLFSTEINLVSITCWHLTKVFQRIPLSPPMFHWYLLNALVSKLSLKLILLKITKLFFPEPRGIITVFWLKFGLEHQWVKRQEEKKFIDISYDYNTLTCAYLFYKSVRISNYNGNRCKLAFSSKPHAIFGSNLIY